MTRTVGIFVFENIEVLDFAGPFEVFTTASRVFGRTNPDAAEPFKVCTVAQNPGTVRARAGLVIQPDFVFKSHPSLDVLIVPGGVVTNELEKPEVIAWISKNSKNATLVASVCTGAFLLAKAGVLQAQSCTTHWEDVDDLKTMFPKLTVKTGVRWVDEGEVVSSAGISAGIDMSLHLVEKLVGRELALKTARQMDFDWTENS